MAVNSEGSLFGVTGDAIASVGSLFGIAGEVVNYDGSWFGVTVAVIGSDRSLFVGMDDVVSSEGSLFGGTGAEVGFNGPVFGTTGTDVSCVGRCRGNGVSDRAGNERCCCRAASVLVTRENHVETSRAIWDRGDRASVWGGDGACAFPDAASSIARNTENVTAFRTRACMVSLRGQRTSYQFNGNYGSAQTARSTVSN